MIARLATALVLASAPTADEIALPTYADGYQINAALGPIMPVCVEALFAEARGGSFAAVVDRATVGLPADRTWRVREVCVAFRSGAQALALIAEAERAARAPPARSSLLPMT